MIGPRIDLRAFRQDRCEKICDPRCQGHAVKVPMCFPHRVTPSLNDKQVDLPVWVGTVKHGDFTEPYILEHRIPK